MPAIDKPTAVAKAADLLLLTVPDDALDNVVKMLVASGAIHAGQYVVHTSGRHGMEVLRPALEIGAHGIAMHPAMTFTGTDVDLDRLPGACSGLRPARRATAGRDPGRGVERPRRLDRPTTAEAPILERPSGRSLATRASDPAR